jgi:hypothetical protein
MGLIFHILFLVCVVTIITQNVPLTTFYAEFVLERSIFHIHLCEILNYWFVTGGEIIFPWIRNELRGNTCMGDVFVPGKHAFSIDPSYQLRLGDLLV